jgi:transposase-like protein
VGSIFFNYAGLRVFGVRAVSTSAPFFHRTRQLYECQACSYQASLTAGTIFQKTRTPLRKWFWMIFLLGRQKSRVSMLSLQRVLRIRTYKTVWTMGHKIRQALAAGDASYQLAGLLEMDDTYSGGPKPGKRDRGAAGKAKVVVAVETPGAKPRFATRRRIPKVGRHHLPSLAQECLTATATGRTDG